MVTSARSGQGKSTVTSNMGIVTAQMGRRVIVVEADMRRPVLHRFFALENQRGLAEVLKGQATLSEALLPTNVENLFLLPSGKPPSNPAELLGSRAMRDLLDLMRSQADMVFLDTPPVSAFSDPLILAREVDAVILAYRARQVPREVDMRARAQLEAMQANILGVVLTNVEPDVCDSYYYHYTYYEAKKREEARGQYPINGSNGSSVLSAPIELEAVPVIPEEHREPEEAEAPAEPPIATATLTEPVEEAFLEESLTPDAAVVDDSVKPEVVESESLDTIPENEESQATFSSAELEAESASETVVDIDSPPPSSQRLRLLLALIGVVVLVILGVYFGLSFLMKGGK
jgi:capsular exopolysaccharide synthesis family protein